MRYDMNIWFKTGQHQEHSQVSQFDLKESFNNVKSEIHGPTC